MAALLALNIAVPAAAEKIVGMIAGIVV